MLNSYERARSLKRVQKYFFTAYDLHLFLDTHPFNKDALKMYIATLEKAKNALNEFEEKYGPLTPHSGVFTTEQWNWIENPWPWDSLEN